MDKFIITVKQMREAQKRYFRYRTSIELNQAKKLEKEVDDMIREREREDNDKLQLKLF